MKKVLVLACLLFICLNAFSYSDRPIIVIEEGDTNGITDWNGMDWNANWLNATVLCIDGNCQTSWPGGGGSGTDTVVLRTYTGEWGVAVDSDANTIRIADDFNGIFDDFFYTQDDANNLFVFVSDSNNDSWLVWSTIADGNANIINLGESLNWNLDTNIADTNWATFDDFNRMFYSQTDANNVFVKISDSNNSSWLAYTVIADWNDMVFGAFDFNANFYGIVDANNTFVKIEDSNNNAWLTYFVLADANETIINLGEGQGWDASGGDPDSNIWDVDGTGSWGLLDDYNAFVNDGNFSQDLYVYGDDLVFGADGVVDTEIKMNSDEGGNYLSLKSNGIISYLWAYGAGNDLHIASELVYLTLQAGENSHINFDAGSQFRFRNQDDSDNVIATLHSATGDFNTMGDVNAQSFCFKDGTGCISTWFEDTAGTDTNVWSEGWLNDDNSLTQDLNVNDYNLVAVQGLDVNVICHEYDDFCNDRAAISVLTRIKLNIPTSEP